LLHGDVDHEAVRRGAVPVILARLEEETQSPGPVVSIGPPSRWQRPTPSVTKIVCLAVRVVCQAVRDARPG
jgi:hypothetical protein